MWFILFLSLSFIMPAISVKSLRAKVIYFLNALIITWIVIDSSKPFIEQVYLNNIDRISIIRTLSLVILSFLSVFYLIYGLSKLIQRRSDFKKIFSKNHNFNIKDHFNGELNGEERLALAASFPGIITAVVIIIIYVLQLQ